MSAKRIRLAVLIVSAIVLAVAIGSGSASATHAPSLAQELAREGVTIPYPGRLSGEGGQPAADGAYDLAFSLYNVETGGEALWSEVQKGVAARGGSFNTTLGSVEPIPSVLLDGGERWLAVGVRGPGEAGFAALTPRQRLSPNAPAARASSSNGATCEHDHFGESWSGSSSSYGFRVENNGTREAIKAYSHAAANWSAIYALNSGEGKGVWGSSSAGHGVFGSTNGNWGYVSGVYGIASQGAANGVTGWNTTSGPGVYGYSNGGYAGYFNGNVNVTGSVSKGGGSFKIDHPLDPENKYLYHSFVESPDMMNVYNGNVTLDANGEAWVDLPEWFEALNEDFRYQLTPIGGPGPNLYIAQGVQDNRFQIAGGAPGLRVSWQVTGIRHDAWAEAHRIPVEEDKPQEEQGTYLHPVEHDQPETSGLDYHWASSTEGLDGGGQ